MVEVEATRAHLQVFVEDAPHGGEGAIGPLVFDEPGLGGAKLFGVDEDETPRLSERLQHKRRQPAGRRGGSAERRGDKRGDL